MTLPNIEFVLNNIIVILDLEELQGSINDDIIRDFPKDIRIKAHPRRDRPNKQQVYINNKYYMTIPCSVFNPDEDLRDPYNFYGNQFIYLIKELYKRGYSLNKIKTILNIVLGSLYNHYCKPQY